MTPVSLGNIILLKEKGENERSIPSHVDKKSGCPEEERGIRGSWGVYRGLECSRRKKGQTSFIFFLCSLSTFLSLSHIKWFFSLCLKLMITEQTTQFKFCARDYTTTIYPAWGQFLLPENLLTNPDVKRVYAPQFCVVTTKIWSDGH